MNSADVRTVSVDVASDQDIETLIAAVKSLRPSADIIINSAGIVSGGKLHETPIEEWDRLHGINVRGLVLVLQALIPDMIRSDRAQRHIVNVSSAAGYAGSPGMSAYGATKAAVIALSESLRVELAPFDIGVTVLCPGYVKTPIAETIQLFGSMNNPKTQKRIEQMFRQGNLSPERVAEQTLKAIDRNKAFVSVGRDAIGAHYLRRLSPQLLARAVGAVSGG